MAERLGESALGESAPPIIAVTDPLLDAPDGAVVTFANGGTYERIGLEWCRLDDQHGGQPYE